MAGDENNQQGTVASSTTGVQQMESPGDVLETLTGEERQEWLKSGKLPERGEQGGTPSEGGKPAKEVKSDDKPASSTGAAPAREEGAEKKPESATGKTDAEVHDDGKPKTEGERRIKDLSAQIRQLQQELQTERSKNAAPPKEPPAKPAPEAEPQAPNAEDYEDIDKYIADKISFEVGKAVKADREARKTEDAQAQLKAKATEAFKVWQQRCAKAREAHADFDAVALAPDLQWREGSVFDRWTLRSELGPEMLYYYGQHRDEFAELNGMDDYDAVRALAALEGKLQPKEPAKKEPPPAPKVSGTPPPPSEVRTGATPTDDPIAEAINKGDAGTYMRLQNAKEAKKGK